MERRDIGLILLGILTLVAVGFVLKAAKAVVVPLVIAWLLSYILAPAVGAMVRHRFPRSVAVFAVLLLLVGICVLGGFFLGGRIAAFAEAAPKYSETIGNIISSAKKYLRISDETMSEIDKVNLIGSALASVSGSLLGFFSNLVLVVMFLMFLLVGRPYFPNKMKKAFSPDEAERIGKVVVAISGQISRYLAVQCLISLATGVLVWAALAIIGVDFAVTWGALAFFLNFIPNIGSIVATILPVSLAFLQYFPNPWYGLIALACLSTIQITIGNILSPKVMGDQLDLSPVVLLFGLLFWGWLWGVIGALLSVPIAVAIKIVCENVPMLDKVAVMMRSGR